jgi:uncharacterized membrane protein YoaK (UPF0700 family)
MLLMAAAMGAQNGAAHRGGDIRLSLTYVTESLVRLGQKVVDAVIEGGAKRWAWAPCLTFWTGLFSGAVLGGALFIAWGMSALLVPVPALIALAALSAAQGDQDADLG